VRAVGGSNRLRTPRRCAAAERDDVSCIYPHLSAGTPLPRVPGAPLPYYSYLLYE
jgi:hypothetical protein